MNNLPTIIYTPESPLKNPARLLREMFRDLLASRELAWRLFVRDTSANIARAFSATFGRSFRLLVFQPVEVGRYWVRFLRLWLLSTEVKELERNRNQRSCQL